MLPWKNCIKRRSELRGRKQNAINDNSRVCSLAFFHVLARSLCSIFVPSQRSTGSPLFYGQPLRFIPSPLHL